MLGGKYKVKNQKFLFFVLLFLLNIQNSIIQECTIKLKYIVEFKSATWSSTPTINDIWIHTYIHFKYINLARNICICSYSFASIFSIYGLEYSQLFGAFLTIHEDKNLGTLPPKKKPRFFLPVRLFVTIFY